MNVPLEPFEAQVAQLQHFKAQACERATQVAHRNRLSRPCLQKRAYTSIEAQQQALRQFAFMETA